MTERIPLRYTVALLGFSAFEHSALASFFRLAEARTPAYEETGSLDTADFVVVNADHAPTVTAVRDAGRLRDAVLIGAQVSPDAAARLQRPIAPTHIVRELDALLEQRLALLDTTNSPDWGASEPGLLGTADTSRQGKDVLVVDDSRVALRFMQVRLQRRGYRVHVAHTPEEAVERLGAQPFTMVFLDVALGPRASMDGLALCQRIKQGRLPAGHDVPKVVMVTGLSSSSDRVRGELAGCDVYLPKPLMEEDLDEALRVLDPSSATAA
jgi:CheY-like chemotaxis protein